MPRMIRPYTFVGGLFPLRRRKEMNTVGLTTDPNDPRLTHGADDEPVPQAKTYLVLSDAERAKGFVRPVRRSYVHTDGQHPCGTVTIMDRVLAETFARDPSFYGATYCVTCRQHLAVNEFAWDGDGQRLGT